MITQLELEQSKTNFERWVGITPERHHWLIYESGLKRLNTLAVPGSAYHAKLEASAQFWNWWKRDWNTKNLTAMYNVGIDPFITPTDEDLAERHTLMALKDAALEQHKFPHYSKPILKQYLKTI